MRIRSSPRTIRGLVITVALISGIISLLLAVAMILIVHWELERQLDQRIEGESSALLDFYEAHDFDELARIIALRDQQRRAGDIGYLAGIDDDGRATVYLLLDARGVRRAGSFAATSTPPGWSEFVHFRRPDGSTGTAQALNSALPDGGQLVVAADRTVIDQMHWKILELFAAGFGLMLALGLLVTIGFGRAIRRRLAAIETSAEAIMAGDLSSRMPLDGSNGEFDRLSRVLNRLLDRMNDLLENLRQVTGDIAHDLRTPLQRVRARLEKMASRANVEPFQGQLEEALRETDDLLELFSSLLAISEIEGQSVRSRFVALDLLAAVEEVADLYRPTIEDMKHALTVAGTPVIVRGDRKLLQQAVANLLDNALLHTPEGTTSCLWVGSAEGQAVLRIADDGPGIPATEHDRIFRRLTRLNASRAKPGHGLGLSTVAAIASAHGGTVRVLPVNPGLTIELRIPAFSSPPD